MEAAAARADTEGAARLVVFGLGGERLALPMACVREIVRMLPLQPVPRAPAPLLGLANLRGRVLPVLDLRRLLGAPAREPDEAARILVLETAGSRLGLVVDRVLRVAAAGVEPVAGGERAGGLLGSAALAGVVRAGGELVQVLALEPLLAPLSAGIAEAAAAAEGRAGGFLAEAGGEREAAQARGEADEACEQLVAFHAGGQELALPIGEVREIVRLPERLERVPDAAPHAIGVMDLRGETLPLLDLAAALGLGETPAREGSRVLVVPVPAGGRRAPVGLVVERVREVLRVPESAREGVPALLARGGGMDEIDHVCRLEGGRRLVPVLATARLGALEAVRAAAGGEEEAMLDEALTAGTPEAAAEEDEVQLVVFQLDGEEYGVPVEAVREITRVPERLSRVPMTPPWVVGLVNLRGAVLPVLDMRERFGLAPAARSERQRILVLELGGCRTGFVTDAVTEVLGVPRALLESAPRLSEAQARLMGRVVNLPDSGRMIVVIDPARLVDDDERAALEESSRAAA